MTDATVLAHHHQPTRQDNPFAHLLDSPCLVDEHYDALVQTFPAVHLFAPDAARRDNAVLRIDSSRVLSEAAFSDAWKRFVHSHTSQAFWGQIVRQFGADMRRVHPGLEAAIGRPLDEWKAVRRGADQAGDVTLECQIVINTPVIAQASAVKAPHVDHVTKLWTGLLYLRDPADDSRGGDLELYGSPRPVRFDAHQAARSDVVVSTKVSYQPNAFVGFVNGPQAVHSVSPRAPTPHVRRYVDFVAELDRPVFRLPQMNSVRRLCFRLFQRGAESMTLQGSQASTSSNPSHQRQPSASGVSKASVRNTVFIHTNPKQIIGALVAQHALRRHSAAPDRFEVRILQTTDFPALQRFEGRRYLREGRQVVWLNDDLQSFTPLRFAVPEAMGYSGRAVLTDPDVFALGDINRLLERDMGAAAVMARQMDSDFRRPLHYASSVMLLDCARLAHWQWEADFERVFRSERDYRDWMWLLLEPPGSVAPLESTWNDFDRLAADTQLLHNTHRRTQPWKTGLPSDFTPRGTTLKSRLGIWLRALKGRGSGRYKQHPDPAQERFFFRLLGECLDNGSVPAALLEEEMARQHIRSDAHDCIAQARRIAA